MNEESQRQAPAILPGAEKGAGWNHEMRNRDLRRRGLLRTFFEQPRQVRARRWIFQIHLYAGLLLGLYVVVVGVSGSALVFRPEIEHVLLMPRPLVRPARGDALPFQAAWNNLRHMYPDTSVIVIYTYQYPGFWGDPYKVKLKSANGQFFYVYVDSVTGDILGSLHPGIQWLQDLHFNLLGGPNGQMMNGVGAALVVMMCISGAVVWWPGRRNWSRGFAVYWRAPWQNINYDLHRVLGVTTVALLTAVAVAGVYLAFRNLREEVEPVDGDHLGWQASLDSWPVNLDAVVQRAEAALPGGTRTSFSLPQNPMDTFRLSKSFPYGPRTRIVYLDQGTGQVLRVDNTLGASMGARIIDWIDRILGLIHFGRFGGLGTRAAWVLLGLAPAGLFLSGFLMWWNRVLFKKLRRFKRARSRSRSALSGRF